jgi:4-amino-4-deoxychorismate lyase
MSRLIESIRLYKGEFNNVSYHQERMDRAGEALGWEKNPDLQTILQETTAPQTGLYKYRLVYDNKMHQGEFIPYMAKSVNSLKLVFASDIIYDHKFEDRRELDHQFRNRGFCDDILIVKNGGVTDTSIANIVFKKGKEWFTPATCLLKGTMRQSLLDKNVIREMELTMAEIFQFESFKLINSMLTFDGPEVSIENIQN